MSTVHRLPPASGEPEPEPPARHTTAAQRVGSSGAVGSSAGTVLGRRRLRERLPGEAGHREHSGRSATGRATPGAPGACDTARKGPVTQARGDVWACAA